MTRRNRRRGTACGASGLSQAPTDVSQEPEIGHGNIAPNAAHGGVTITSAQRFATVSFAGLDRLGFGAASHEAAVAARTALAAYALLSDRLAFSAPSVWLRSGCEARQTGQRTRGGRREVHTRPAPSARQPLPRATPRRSPAGRDPQRTPWRNAAPR